MNFRSQTIGGQIKILKQLRWRVMRGGRPIETRDTLAPDPKTQAALALHRFGFGPRAGSIAAIASDPRGALLAELDRKGAGLASAPGLMSSAQSSRAIADFNAERQSHE